mgnify:CR=1 FL=1
MSHDLLHKHRTLPEGKRRGRWASDASLKRYAKESRALSELRKVHPAVIEFGNRIGSLFPKLLAGAVASAGEVTKLLF